MRTYLIDADGVAIKKHPYFSVQYAERFDVPIEQMYPFFRQRFPLCMTGKADIREEVAPLLADWKWEGTAEEFLACWFESEDVPDERVLEIVAQLRADGHKCYLASDQERYRSAYVLDTMGFRTKFDGYFFSCNMGAQKSDPTFFTTIIHTLQIPPEDIEYYDDDPNNIAIAAGLGICGRVFERPEDIVL